MPQSEFNHGIDPKLFFDPHNLLFGFNFWNPWDREKKKPVNFSISSTADPKGTWNTYPIPAPIGVDAGGNGFSRQWVGYSFPGGPERSFVFKTAQAKAGQPLTVWHFAGHLGHPVKTQDAIDELYFVDLTDKEILITKVADGGDGSPVVASVARKPHGFKRHSGRWRRPHRPVDHPEHHRRKGQWRHRDRKNSLFHASMLRFTPSHW